MPTFSETAKGEAPALLCSKTRQKELPAVTEAKAVCGKINFRQNYD
jgi:hypothetical protein